MAEVKTNSAREGTGAYLLCNSVAEFKKMQARVNAGKKKK